jgi:DNA mismatch endonuclease (patch repair protein)
MARIRGKNTQPELQLARALHVLGYAPEHHAGDLAGRPDFVYRNARVVVFVDGDFWHGWHFQAWRHKLTRQWELKISANRARDARKRRALRRDGWTVIRIWEHQIKRDLPSCVDRVGSALGQGPARSRRRSR